MPQFAIARLLVADAEFKELEVERDMRRRGENTVMVEIGFVRRVEGMDNIADVNIALSAARRAAHANPLYSEAYSLLTAAHTMRGDLRAGIASARKALALDAQDFSSCRRLGKLLLALDPPMCKEVLGVVGSCIEGVTRKLAATAMRECALALYDELVQMSTIIVHSADSHLCDNGNGDDERPRRLAQAYENAVAAYKAKHSQ
jgi:tetratricopeptide (TPR) repeat protein